MPILAEPQATLAEKPRTRSPAYPSMGLEEAIERARLLYERVQDHLVPLQSIAVEWETNTKSSVFMQTISALKQFGLLEDEGKGEERQAKISSLAKTIINHQDSSRERDSALKIAALFPKIHQEIWLKYKGGLPPADSPIRAYLLERKRGPLTRTMLIILSGSYGKQLPLQNLPKLIKYFQLTRIWRESKTWKSRIIRRHCH